MAQGRSQHTGKSPKDFSLHFSSKATEKNCPFVLCRVRLDTPEGLGSQQEATRGLSRMHKPPPRGFQCPGHSSGERFHSFRLACKGVSPVWQPKSHCLDISRNPYIKMPWDGRPSTWPWHMMVPRPGASCFTSLPSERPFPVYENVYKNTYFTESWCKVNNRDADQKFRTRRSYFHYARRQRSFKKLFMDPLDN